jgi:hypothetical protein
MSIGLFGKEPGVTAGMSYGLYAKEPGVTAGMSIGLFGKEPGVTAGMSYGLYAKEPGVTAGMSIGLYGKEPGVTAGRSIGLYGKEPGVTSVNSKVTNGFQFGKHTSLSVTGTGFGPHSSKLGFGSHFVSPKHQPLQNASAFANVLPANSNGDQKCSGRACSFPSGSTELKQSDGHTAAPHTALFSFTGSGCGSQLNLQRRPRCSRRFRKFVHFVLI